MGLERMQVTKNTNCHTNNINQCRASSVLAQTEWVSSWQKRWGGECEKVKNGINVEEVLCSRAFLGIDVELWSVLASVNGKAV